MPRNGKDPAVDGPGGVLSEVVGDNELGGRPECTLCGASRSAVALKRHGRKVCHALSMRRRVVRLKHGISHDR